VHPVLPAWFVGQGHVTQALLATLCTWSVTALGASVVFFFRRVDRKVMDVLLGFAGGVMVAASYWSLLAPSVEMARALGMVPWLPAVGGFVIGGAFLRLLDLVLPHLHPGMSASAAEGMPTRWKRAVLLVLAITLHNIPEGLAVGVAFGAVAHGLQGGTLGAAVALAIGIGLQNFPEGLAVAAPLRREGLGRLKSFWYGQLSGVVEPIAGVAGALAVVTMRPLLPWALGFASGAMVFVVIEELVPEAQRSRNSHMASYGFMFGFCVMTMLDVGLG
jgi:ZIP family zinc transporter